VPIERQRRFITSLTANIMSAINLIKAPIKDELQEFDSKFFASVRSEIKILNIIIQYYLKRKGKQLRPILVFLSAKLAGNVTNSTYSAAVLVELMHNATLVHDDVVDDSQTRRGFFTINALWKNKIAVLVGDFFLAKGLLISIKEKEYRLLEILSEAVQEMSEGELMQIEKARKLDITEETYFEIIRKKTATLLSASIAAGLVSAGCDVETEKLGRELGECLGIAFQIRDDLLDYESTNIIGKPSGNDIRERKITLPLIHALASMPANEKKEALSVMKIKNKSQKQVEFIVDKVKQNNGIEYTKQKMEQYKNKALSLTMRFPETDARNSFCLLINYIVERKK
jgi:octaprenyl-diphosphate synthase